MTNTLVNKDEGNSLDFRIIEAADKGDVKAIKELIKAGADVNCKDQDGFSVLIAASSRGHAEATKVLIEAGADVNYKTGGSGDTALLEAAGQFFNTHHEYAKTAEILLEAGAYINHQQKEQDWTNHNQYKPGMSALMEASVSGNIELTKLLLRFGANTNLKSHLFGHAREMASVRGHTEIVKEIDEFNEAPVKYILDHNNQANVSLKAIHNLEHSNIGYFDRIKVCLEAQPDGFIEDLNAICGNNGSYYNEQSEL